MYTGYGPASPPLTNNPFLTQTDQSVTSRFPDISSQTLNNNGTAWSSGSMVSPGGFPYQQQPSLHQQTPVQNGYMATSPTGYGISSMQSGYISPSTSSFPPFQTQSYGTPFGQQQPQLTDSTSASHVSGSSYSYLTGQQQQPNSSYTPAQLQLHNNPGYFAQFDPYSSIGKGWDGSGGWANNNNNKTSGQLDPNFGVQVTPSVSTGSTLSSASSTSSAFSAGTTSSLGVGPKGDPHPKDYIRTHKSEIEAWDTYAWKQLLGAFEAMKNAWEARKDELMVRAKAVISQSQTGMAYGGYYAQQIQQEATRLQQLIKEAESNFGSVAASSFQMQEVFQGYRQSSDAASKSRVREATNAALHGLPGWPQPL